MNTVSFNTYRAPAHVSYGPVPTGDDGKPLSSREYFAQQAAARQDEKAQKANKLARSGWCMLSCFMPPKSKDAQ